MSYLTKQFDDKLISLLKSGAVGFMPSDTIYGLSALALNQQAVERIYDLKVRDKDKPYIVLIADIAQLRELDIDPAQTKVMENIWPAPVSLECDVRNAPAWLNRGQKHEAIRMPNDYKLLKLIREVGPIISTSPNPQGGEPAKSVKEARKYFGDKLDFYVDVGPISGLASTMVKQTDGKLEIIRQGAYRIPA